MTVASSSVRILVRTALVRITLVLATLVLFILVGTTLGEALLPSPVHAQGYSAAAAIEHALETTGTEAAWTVFRDFSRTPGNVVDEGELNELGYRLLHAGRVEQAVAVFEMAVEAFPGSWNTWDSLGEAYTYADREEDAVNCYRTALRIDHENDGATWALRKLAGNLDARRRETRTPARHRPGESTGTTGPYFGQEPPGLMPKVFAPGIVSTRGNFDFGCAFAPDGREVYFNRGSVLMVSRLEEDGWTAPEPTVFAREYDAFEAHVSRDGLRLFFGSGPEIWVADRENGGWGPVRRIGSGMCATTSDEGTLYLTDISAGYLFGRIVRRAAGPESYGDPQPVGEGPDSTEVGAHPCIAPDESFLLFDSWREGGRGQSDFYVRFRRDDGSWGDACHLGNAVNSIGENICVTLSPDGAYLFFTLHNDIYWVSAAILEECRE